MESRGWGGAEGKQDHWRKGDQGTERLGGYQSGYGGVSGRGYGCGGSSIWSSNVSPYENSALTPEVK